MCKCKKCVRTCIAFFNENLRRCKLVIKPNLLSGNKHQATEKQQRCSCNKLLCVIKEDTIEIKCNKCKRIMQIKTKGIESVEVK